MSDEGMRSLRKELEQTAAERDSLTTRLAEAEQRARLAVHAAEQVKNPEFVKALDEAGVEYVEQLVERIAEVERERDEAVDQADDAAIDFRAEIGSLRSQLTQAREALERIAAENPVALEDVPDEDDIHGLGVWYANTVSSYKSIARQALATINREGGTP